MQELELLDKDNKPLSHAKYHCERVRKAGERESRPLPLEIPEYLEQKMRAYLEQVSPRSICLTLDKIYRLTFVSQTLVFTIKAHFWSRLFGYIFNARNYYLGYRFHR